MDNRLLIQRSVDYIEENLQAELRAEELAKLAGFSVYHYCRLFQSVTGLTVKRFILRRRLCHAIYAVRCGSTGVDAALRYGFDTYAGFYRAFLREFGCTPAAFLRAGRAKRPYRPDLTKEDHMTITKQKAAVILRHWGLENEPLSEIYYEGTGNRNERAYYVGEYRVLKFTGDLAALSTSIALSKALAAAGLCAATPVATLDGRDYVQEDAQYFCLTHRLPGRQLAAEDCFGDKGPALAESIGETIGRLHRALLQIDVPVDEADLLQSLRSWALPQAKAILHLDEAFCADYLAQLETLQPQLPRQIIHRDPNPGNLIGSDAGWGFIDFELSERNVRIYDPCYAATAILSECFTKQDAEKLESWLEIYQSILRGYDRVANLSEAERRAAPYVLMANQLICVAYFSRQERFAEIFETNKAMTRWLLARWERLALA